MKPPRSMPTTTPSDRPEGADRVPFDAPADVGQASLNRRRVFVGAGAVGAVATVAAVLPLTPRVDPQPVAADTRAADAPDGYQVTDHVLRYYQTARV